LPVGGILLGIECFARAPKADGFGAALDPEVAMVGV